MVSPQTTATLLLATFISTTAVAQTELKGFYSGLMD